MVYKNPIIFFRMVRSDIEEKFYYKKYFYYTWRKKNC